MEIDRGRTHDQIAAVNCDRQACALAGPTARRQGGIARLGRRLGAGVNEEADETDHDYSR